MFYRNIKPSRGLSVVIMATGIIMGIFGAVSGVPTKGTFGIIWTLIIVLIVVFGGINAFGSGFPLYRIDSDDRSSECSIPGKSLEIIQRLYDQRLISEEEYKQLRKNIRC